MTESASLLPSEVARLVLGYIRDEGYVNTFNMFIKECQYLTEYVGLLKQGRELPLSVAGFTLTFIIDEYFRLKNLEKILETRQTNTNRIVNQLQTIAQLLKFEPDKRPNSYSQSATQGARMKRQINDNNKSPQKRNGTLKTTETSARVLGNACNRRIVSPTPDIQTLFNGNSNESVIDITSVSDVTSVNGVTSVSDVTTSSVTAIDNLPAMGNTAGPVIITLTPVNKQAGIPDAERLESCNRRLQELLDKNASPGPKSKTASGSGVQSLSNVNSDSNSAINGKETVQVDYQTAQENDIKNNNGIPEETNDIIESHVVECSEEKNVNERTSLTAQSEATPSTSKDPDKASNLENEEPPPKEVPKTPQKPETSEVTNSNTCDSWYNGAVGVKGGDKLLEKFGIQQTSSTDSTDQEVVEHMQAPVTPTKSRPPTETGLVTPVKQLQTEEHVNKSPRRKKPKTPRKRLSDINKTPSKRRGSDVEKPSTSRAAQEDLHQEPTVDAVKKVVQHMIHDETVLAKLTEISNTIIDHRQNRSHNKSGEEEPHHGPTAEELETIAASNSLEEILETESFGQDLNLDLSDPVFEGLFKLFGTDKEAFHENLRREKHKTLAMEAEVEELEKSIHEEIAEHCGALIGSQGDEGYETQRTPENIFGSPRPGCSSQAGTLEMSSPISQPYTPHSQIQETSFTSSPRDKENPAISLAENEPVHSPIQPCSPYSNQSELFSPASHATHPFSPALTEQSFVSEQRSIQSSTPQHDRSDVYSSGDKTLEPESPFPGENVSMKSPTFMPSTPHIVHQNPPQSPDELTSSVASRRTPIPCSPLVKNDIQPGTPHMVQKYNTPFTPQSKHKSIMAAGTVRHLFSPQVYSPTSQVYSPTPQVYSPTTQKNAQVMIQTNLENGVPQFTQEVEVNATSQTGTQTSTNQSMNYTKFVSGVNTADSRSTPISVRSASVFHGDPLTTIDNTIGCISLPPSQSAGDIPPISTMAMPPPQGKGKGKRGGKGKEKKTLKKTLPHKAQPQSGFSTLIGLLSKPPQSTTVEPQPEPSTPVNTGPTTLSMPVLTEQADHDSIVITEQGGPGTVLLNALEDDIHDNSISILSPGGHNCIQVPILRCQDVETETPHEGGDIVSQAMSASNVIGDNETVCVWSQNLNTSTQLTIFSPPSDAIDSAPVAETPVTDSGIRDLEAQVQNNTPMIDNVQKNVKRNSKKKLNLDYVDNVTKQVPTSSAVRDTNYNTQFCQPGEMLIAEPLHLRNPQKKVFMRSLNFGPNAGTTKGSMMPSRKVSKGSALAPFSRKKSTDKPSDFASVSVKLTDKSSAVKPTDKSSDFSSVSVNLTKDIKYRKIMPKLSGQIPVALNIVPTPQTAEIATDETIAINSDSEVPRTDPNNHYDSDTMSCGNLSPIKRQKKCDKLTSQHSSKTKTDAQKSDNKAYSKVNPKESKSPSKTKTAKTQKDSVTGEKFVSPKSKHPSESIQTKQSPKCPQKETKKSPKCSQNERVKSPKCSKKIHDDKLMVDHDEKKLNKAYPKTVNEKGDRCKGIEMKKSLKETVQPKENSKTVKSKASSKGCDTEVVGTKRQEQESNKKRNTKENFKKGRKKPERPLMKVKIISSKAKSQTDKNQLKLCKSGNKLSMKSPTTMRERKNSKTEIIEVTTDSDTDEDVPLNVLKGLQKNTDDIVNETEINGTENESDKQKVTAGVNNSELNEPVKDICPKTPEKSTRSPVSPGTPSQEQMLEKLGLTPKKNAEEILQNLQSPSIKHLDLFVQLTPIDKRKTPKRRKGQNNADDNMIRSPSRSFRTPNKRLFGSPNKVAANTNKTSAECDKYSQSTSTKAEDSNVHNKKSKPKNNKVDVGKAGDIDAVLEQGKDRNIEKTVKENGKPINKGKGKLTVKEKPKPSAKNSQKDNEKELGEKKNPHPLEKLKKEEKTVTPLKLINLLGEIKVDCARNKQSKGSKKRDREESDKELENEISKDKPTKKARNSLDLSVLDYDKMMSKLAKIHK